MTTPPPKAMQASEVTDIGGEVIGWTWPGEHESVLGGVLTVWFAQYAQAQEPQVIGFDGATRDDAEWFVRLSHNIAERADAEAKIVRDRTRRHLREGEVMVYLPCDGGIDEGEDLVEVARCGCGLSSLHAVPALRDEYNESRFRPEVAELIVAAINRRYRVGRGHHIAAFENDAIVLVRQPHFRVGLCLLVAA